MDQNSVWFIAGLIVILIILSMSGFGVWVAWQRSRRERLGETHTDYRYISAPEVRSHRRRSPEIQWGDDDQHDADNNVFSSNATDDRPHCPLCQQPIYQSDEHCCPSCKEKYHKPCWAEYNKTCVICGKAEN